MRQDHLLPASRPPTHITSPLKPPLAASRPHPRTATTTAPSPPEHSTPRVKLQLGILLGVALLDGVSLLPRAPRFWHGV